MLNLALTTLPLYSLAVLLGSDLKDTHERHEPLAERLHKIFKHTSGSQVLHSAMCTLCAQAASFKPERQIYRDSVDQCACLPSIAKQWPPARTYGVECRSNP